MSPLIDKNALSKLYDHLKFMRDLTTNEDTYIKKEDIVILAKAARSLLTYASGKFGNGKSAKITLVGKEFDIDDLIEKYKLDDDQLYLYLTGALLYSRDKGEELFYFLAREYKKDLHAYERTTEAEE